MNLIESVYDVSKDIMFNADYVFFDRDRIDEVADEIKKSDNTSFFEFQTSGDYNTVLIELIASSINYCYWYGKYNIRPNGSSSGVMYQTVEDAFADYDSESSTAPSFEDCINYLIELLSIRRFPLLEERRRHLLQLTQHGNKFADLVYKNRESVIPHMETLVSTFPGFASDIFLKRASLFFIQLYRRFGWFENDMHILHVPADYQIPKMLNDFGCIVYDDYLQELVNTNQMIPKHSQLECEIRAATVLCVQALCRATGWNVGDIDAYFFMRRHESESPFHLTITTDY